MECPQCGYLMTPFDKDCPRCIRTEARQLQQKLLQKNLPVTEEARNVTPLARPALPRKAISQVEITPPPMTNIYAACPQCGSSDWKLASLVHQEGSQTLNANTSGIGIGAGLGVGGANTSGTIQSGIAKQAAPPTGFAGTAALIAVAVISLVIAICNPYFLILTCLCLALLFIVVPKETREHREAVVKWMQLRMCLRCGRFF